MAIIKTGLVDHRQPLLATVCGLSGLEDVATRLPSCPSAIFCAFGGALGGRQLPRSVRVLGWNAIWEKIGQVFSTMAPKRAEERVEQGSAGFLFITIAVFFGSISQPLDEKELGTGKLHGGLEIEGRSKFLDGVAGLEGVWRSSSVAEG